MAAYDYSSVPPPRSNLIPDTIATIRAHIRPGGVGEDGLLKRNKDGDCEMLDFEFVLLDGDYARRKFWGYQIVNGTTPGQQEMAATCRGIRKQMLQSARNIIPSDTSPEARVLYQADLKDFDGIIFMGKVGTEKGKPRNDGSGGFYDDKNVLVAVITPDKKEYRPITQAPPFDGGGAAAPSASGTVPPPTNPPITKPDWAS